MLILKKSILLLIIALLLFSSVVSSFESAYYLDENKVKQKDNDFFDLKIKNLMKIGGLPSISACIIKNNSVVWNKAYGYADIENNVAATSKTLYCIGSIHKTITATAMMQLYERSIINLSDDVNLFLPFKLRNPNFPNDIITIEMLLSHRSSIARDPPTMNNLSFSLLKEYLTENGNLYDSSYWKDYAPDEGFEYSTINYQILRYILELVTNQTCYDYYQENIFSPLEMNCPGVGYDKNLSAIPYERFLMVFKKIENETFQGWFEYSVLDLSHFLIAHMNKGVYNGTRILDESTVALMHSIKSFRSELSGFFNGLRYEGLGWNINIKRNGEITEGHTGVLPGGSAVMKFKRISGEIVGVIFFTNVMTLLPLYNPRGYVSTFLIERSLFNKAERMD